MTTLASDSFADRVWHQIPEYYFVSMALRDWWKTKFFLPFCGTYTHTDAAWLCLLVLIVSSALISMQCNGCHVLHHLGVCLNFLLSKQPGREFTLVQVRKLSCLVVLAKVMLEVCMNSA